MLQKKALLANIHAAIVNISPRATVEVQDGVVTLDNLQAGLRNDGDLRQKTAERLIKTYGLKDVIFAKPVKAKKDYVNPFHNIDVK
jgi:hypothetical protein